MKTPTDLQAMCDDLKLCGRREYSHLIRLRHKYQATVKQIERDATRDRTKGTSDHENSAKPEPTEAEVEA